MVELSHGVKRFKLLLLPAILVFVLSFAGYKILQKPRASVAPKPIRVVVKDGQKGYVRQVVSSAKGGEVAADDTKVVFPQNFSDKNVTAAYRELATTKIAAANSLSPMFELTAKTDSGESVSNFEKPLKIVQKLDASDVAKYRDISKIALYFFNTTSKKWEKLESKFDPATNELIAYTTHFTVFMVAGDDPNAGITQAVSDPLIIDDGDPEPAFVPGGQTDPDQPEFWDFIGSGYNGSARYTGNSINNTPHNWATWSVFSGLTGDVEVFVTIPAMPGKNLTAGATYKITHAGVDSFVTVNQAANAGKTVSLGTFNFSGSGAVYLNDVVPEKGASFLSFIIFDAVSFGVPLDPNLDITPPKIENVKPHTDNGQFVVEAKVTDLGSGVDSVAVYLNGQFYPMQKQGDIYSVKLPYGMGANLDYYIVAKDKAGNQSVWNPKRGYVSRGAFTKGLGNPPWALCQKNMMCQQAADAKSGSGQFSADPVNTLTGNLMDQESLLVLRGRPEINFYLTFNNQSGWESIFGQGWTHAYNYHLLEMNNADFVGAYVTYPDGQVVKFSGAGFTPEPGRFEKLTKNPGGYELTMTDLTKIVFNNDGDITRWQDNNGNGLNFEYSEPVPFTLVSKLSKITADGGRLITLDYNERGLVSQITAPPGKILKFNYNDADDLTGIVDAKLGEIKFEYSDHNLVKKIYPRGNTAFSNTYDVQRRVVEQTAGLGFKQTFSYSDNHAEITDANNRKTTYDYADDLLVILTDAKGKTEKREYTPNKQVKVLTDRDGYKFEYDYDANGNRTSEKDPTGAEIKRTFNTTFNKPLTEINKLADHKTAWEYDAKGNIKKITDAKNSERTFTYNALGQLIKSTDFNGNETAYTYNPFGDVKTIKDAMGATQTFYYDGYGRALQIKNPKGFIYTYAFDLIDNLLSVKGPLGYKVLYVYDANSNLVKKTDANTGAIKYTYDDSENLVQVADQMNFVTKYAYGGMNEKLSETSPRGRVTNYTYDEVYNLAAKVEAPGLPLESVSKYEYDGRRNVVSETDALNRVTRYKYDELGRKIEEVKNANSSPANAENNVKTTYGYNATGAMTRFVDPNGNAKDYKVDELDRVSQMTDAEMQATFYSYDKQSNLIEVKNPRGYSTHYDYDGANKLVGVTDAKGGKTSFTYDANGNLVKSTDANNIATFYDYNDLDQRTARVANFVDGGATDSQTNVKTQYGYDLNGNITAITNPRGFATNFAYDLDNRNKTITDANSNSTQFVYDKEDNIIKIVDRNGHEKNFAYDIRNRLAKATDAQTNFQTFAYDKLGNLTTFINERGKRFGKVYDPLNRLRREVDPYIKSKIYVYDKNSNLLSLTDENGHMDKYQYDRVNRLTVKTDAEGNNTSYKYDGNGNALATTDGEGNPTNMAYDELDRLIEKVNAEGESEKYAYDKTQNLVLKTEADNTQHQYVYDPLYRLATVVNNFRDGVEPGPDTNVKSVYAYDANGNLAASIDPLAHQTSFSYDKLDRLEKEMNAIDKSYQYAYDAEGNLINRSDGNGVATAYSYYPDDKLQEIKYPTYNVDYKYSETNFPVEMADNLGKTTWVYDDLDRMTSQGDPFGRGLSYEYDFVGNVKKFNYPDGRALTHDYLKNDWLAQSKSTDTDAIVYTRNKVGVPTRVYRTNSSYSAIAYDKVYRPLNVHDQQIDSGDHLISDFSYTYNKLGNIVNEVSKYGWRQPEVVNTKYSYDGLHRLAGASGDDSQQTYYKYDAAGNRVSLKEILKQGTETRTYAYNPANELTDIAIASPVPPNVVNYAYKYDGNGNRVDKLVKDETGVDRGTAYSYDFENRMTRAADYHKQLVQSDTGGELTEEMVMADGKLEGVGMTDLQYDGNGRRLTQTYYPGGSNPGQRMEYAFDRLDPVVEYSMWDGQRNNMYRDGDQNLAFYQNFKSETDPAGTLYWYHYDGEGNIAGTTKHQAQSDHTYRYDEYGTVLPETGSAGWIAPHNQYTLTQKQYDANTNLYYFGARHYDPQTGTWMTQDPYRGQIQNPATLHRYMYNGQSPINYQDFYGYYFGEGFINWFRSLFGFRTSSPAIPDTSVIIPTPTPNPFAPVKKTINGVEAWVLSAPYFNQWLEPNGKPSSPAEGWRMCGAASSVIVAAYYRKISYLDEHDLKEYMYSKGSKDNPPVCGTNKGGAFDWTRYPYDGNGCVQSYAGGIVKYFENIGLLAKISYGSESVSLDDIKKSINAGNPMIFSYEKSNGDSHIAPIVGYTADGRIVVNDTFTNTIENGWDWTTYYSGKEVIYPLDMKGEKYKYAVKYFIKVSQ